MSELLLPHPHKAPKPWCSAGLGHIRVSSSHWSVGATAVLRQESIEELDNKCVWLMALRLVGLCCQVTSAMDVLEGPWEFYVHLLTKLGKHTRPMGTHKCDLR